MKKLKKAYIEITNVCNLSCAFCPGTSRKPGFMGVPEFETVLRKLHGFTDYVYFHVMGEPLLHPDLAKLLELCRLYGYKVNITTNGTLIKDKSGILFGASALRQMNFSVHSHEDADGYAANRKAADHYLANIFSYTDEALEKGGVLISYRLWNLTSEASEQYNAYVVQKLQQKFKPDFSISEALTRLRRITIRDRLFLNCAEVFQWPSGSEDGTGDNSSGDNSPGDNSPGDRGFCLGLRDQVAILVDGTVVPCCLDSDGGIQLGNIFSMDFAGILEGNRARALYNGFSERRAVEELCRKCGYRNRFSTTGTSA
jgi:MoaA/NifB/PqqE/SkfB family radical SAM enzyme